MLRTTDLALRVAKGDFIVRGEYNPAHLNALLKKHRAALAASRKKKVRKVRMLYYALAMPPLILIAIILMRLLGG